MPGLKTGSGRGTDWLAPAGTALAILACYGTLAVVGALSLMGVALAVDEGLWAGAIVLFALLALAGLILGWRVHRSMPPVLLGVLGTALILWTMGASYSRSIEIAGFVFLIAAAWLDWQAKRARRPIADDG